MENKLELFNFENQQVRTLLINGEPKFVSKDVATILGYSRTADAIRTHVDKEDKGVVEIPTPGGKQKVTVINESGLYSLILSSKMPNAKKFKRWVTSEVLPSIRKHGAYMTSESIEKTLSDPDFIINLATQLKSERQARMEAQQQLGKTLIERDKLQDQVEREADDVTFARAITYSNHSIKVRELAAILTQNGFDIGQNQLYNLLRLEGYIGKHDTLPRRDKMKSGYFRVIHGIKNGKAYTTTYVTPKGQKHIINKALKGKFDNSYDKVMTNTFKF